MTNLLKPSEAAKLLRLSEETLKIMRRKGTGPGWVRLSPKIIRYEEDALREWIRNHREGGNGTLQAGPGVVVQIPDPRARGSR